jgi:hypothetical protein
VQQQLLDLIRGEELGCEQVLGGRVLHTAGRQQCSAV